jgi:rod shape determining protein RodA
MRFTSNIKKEIYIPVSMLYMVNFIMFLSFHDMRIWTMRTLLHLIKNSIGLIAFVVMHRMDFKFLKENSFFLYFMTIMMLIFVHFVGMIGLGARRWINLGVFQLQPSELMKITLPLYLSKYLANNGPITFHIFIKYLAIVLLPIGLVIVEPDLATGMILTAISVSLIFIAGISKKYICVSLLFLGFMSPLIWNKMYDYQKERILVFISGRETKTSGYQIRQSRISVGNGGMIGKGFLQGSQFRNSFLPKPDTDFVFSCICEEWGLLGALCVIFLYLYLTLLAIKTSLWKENIYEKYLCVAMGVYIFCSFFLNIAMCIGLLPVMGVPLPVISRGGSATLTFLICMGMLSNIRHNL